MIFWWLWLENEQNQLTFPYLYWSWWPYCLCHGNPHYVIIRITSWYRQLTLQYLPQLNKYYLFFKDPNHHTFIERCLRNHYIIFGETPEPINDDFLHHQLSNWSWMNGYINTSVSSIVQCLCLGCIPIPCHITNFKPWFGPNWVNFVYFCSNLAESGGHIVFVKGISLHHYWEKPLILQASVTFIPTDMESAVLISLWFWLKIALAKNRNPRARV